jgi:hypothetical protein
MGPGPFGISVGGRGRRQATRSARARPSRRMRTSADSCRRSAAVCRGGGGDDHPLWQVHLVGGVEGGFRLDVHADGGHGRAEALLAEAGKARLAVPRVDVVAVRPVPPGQVRDPAVRDLLDQPALARTASYCPRVTPRRMTWAITVMPVSFARNGRLAVSRGTAPRPGPDH